MIYSFGNIKVHEDRREIRLDDTVVQAEPKVFEVLLYLIRNRQRVITRDELLDACWPDIYVSDGSLSRCLSRVRLAIGQPRGADEPILTLYKKGYRFVAAVSEEPDVEPEPDSATAPVPQVSARVANQESERRFITIAAGSISAADDEKANDPELFHAAIKGFFEASEDFLTRYGGVLSRSMNNTFTIQFGYPYSTERVAEAAVLCAMALCERARDFDMKARFGITTGWAIVDAADHDSGQSTVLVDIDPIRPEQLRDLAATGEVVVDTRSLNLVRDAFVSRQTGMVGDGNEPAHALQPRAVRLVDDEDDIAFYGRDGELAHLEQRWHLTVNGRGQVMFVNGVPGVGKTSLVETFVRRNELPESTILRAQCTPYQSLTPFFPLLTLLRQVLKVEADAPPLRQLSAIETALAGKRSLDDDHLPLLASLLSLTRPPTKRSQLNLDPTRQRERTMAALLSLLLSLARDEPTIVWIEDVHWADPSSLALIDQLCTSISETPMFLVLSSRGLPALSAAAVAAATTLTVKPFDHRQTLNFLARCSNDGLLPAGQVQHIATRSDGIPLFIREFIRAGKHAERKDSEPGIPDSLQALLQARLDQAGDVKAVAQWAAALGQEFHKDVLASASALPEQELETGLAHLVERELISPRRFGDGALFNFTHGLLRDAAYDTMLAGQRRERHRRIAEALTSHFPEFVSREPEVIARHFDASDTPDRAAEYWRLAGNASAAQQTTQEARAQYSNAIAAVRQAEDNSVNDDVIREIEQILAAIE